MVYRRILSLNTVDLLIGGFVRIAWRRLAHYIDDEGPRMRSPACGERFEWLANQLEQHGDPRTFG